MGQKKEVQQCRLVTGWMDNDSAEKKYVRKQVKYEAEVHPCNEEG